METIKYQGQEISVEEMGECGGYMGKLLGRPRYGHDRLYRDESGRYYVLRNRRVVADEDDPGSAVWDGSTDFERVHALSLTKAILWSIDLMGPPSFDLRADAAELLRHSQPRLLAPGWMDSRAARLAGKWLEDHPQGDLRDLLNAAADYYLADSEADDVAYDPAFSGECLEAATARRLQTEAEKTARAASRQPQADEGEDAAAETPVGTHRFSFHYPATAHSMGMRRVVELTEAQLVRVQELAGIFGLPIPDFLHDLVHHRRLPGQPRHTGPKLEKALQASHVAFACLEPALAARLERVAQAREQTLDQFVAYAVGSDTDLWEAVMLVHPTTGELLAGDTESLYTEVLHEWTAPALGARHEDKDKSPKTEHKMFVDSRAQALAWRYVRATGAEFPDVVNAALTYALGMTFDRWRDEASEYFADEVAEAVARRQEPAADSHTTETEERSPGERQTFAVLDSRITELLERYADKYPNENPSDTINGALDYALTFELHDEGGEDVSGVVCSIEEAQERRLAREQRAESANPPPATNRRHDSHQPDDVALLAAGMPTDEGDEDEEGEGTTQADDEGGDEK